jgi:malonate decarboxylase acyl carrier protein
VALEELHFEFKADHPEDLPKEWTHAGVVGSGDMEVLMEREDLGGRARIKVVTRSRGFGRVWRLVLEKFIRESRLGNVLVEINDHRATPLVVMTRLRQALADAMEKEV